MKKKIIVTLLTAGLVISTFTACGKTTNNEPTANTEPVVEEQVAEVVEQVVEEEPVEVVDEEPVEVIEEQVEETEEPVEETEEQAEELLPITEYAWDAYRMTDPSELEIVPVKGESYNLNKWVETPSQLLHDVSEEKFQLDDFIWTNRAGTPVYNAFSGALYDFEGEGYPDMWSFPDNLLPDTEPIPEDEAFIYLAGIDSAEYTGMDVFKTYCDKWGFCDAYEYNDTVFVARWFISNDNPIFNDLPIDFSHNEGETEHIGAVISIRVINLDLMELKHKRPWEIETMFMGIKTID